MKNIDIICENKVLRIFSNITQVGKIGSNGVYVSDKVEKRLEPDIYVHRYLIKLLKTRKLLHTHTRGFE